MNTIILNRRLTILSISLLVVAATLVTLFAMVRATSASVEAVAVYDDPVEFEMAAAGLGDRQEVNFDELDAGPLNNTIEGRDPFTGTYYQDLGITFTSTYTDLYLAPGGLPWNESNSLSVFRFPYDPCCGSDNEDSLLVVLDPPVLAVGFTLVDVSTRTVTETIQFLDADGLVITETAVPSDFVPMRAFIGLISPDQPIAAVNVVDDPEDGDDIDYDTFIFIQEIVPLTVTIDIKPGSSINPVNPRSNGVIPLAILSDDTFDAQTVDPLSVSFGPGGAPEAHGKGHREDVDEDGDQDLMLHFETQASGIQCGDTSASLTGMTFDGQAISGMDSLVTVGCNSNKPVEIIEPHNASVQAPGQSVQLYGYAYDTEDGELDGAGFAWTSDLDGHLGQGNPIMASLSKGQHVLTLSTVDADGNELTGSTSLFVGYGTYLPITRR